MPFESRLEVQPHSTQDEQLVERRTKRDLDDALGATAVVLRSVVGQGTLNRQLFTQQHGLIPNNVMHLDEITFTSQLDHR